MKKLLTAVFMLSIFFSCRKGEDMDPEIWATEKFKADYTIEFPANYTGGYIQGFEGGAFEKKRDDSKAIFSYEFDNGLQLFDFGDALADETIDSIAVEDGNILMFLPERTDIILNGNLVGILFHNTLSPIRRAELYWKDGGVFKDALMINYAAELEYEVISIVNTIQPN